MEIKYFWGVPSRLLYIAPFCICKLIDDTPKIKALAANLSLCVFHIIIYCVLILFMLNIFVNWSFESFAADQLYLYTNE